MPVNVCNAKKVFKNLVFNFQQSSSLTNFIRQNRSFIILLSSRVHWRLSSIPGRNKQFAPKELLELMQRAEEKWETE